MAIVEFLSSIKDRIAMISTWDHRKHYDSIIQFLKSSDTTHVLSLRGLRRTGKTTLALQALDSPEAKKLGKSAIIQLEDGDRISLLKGKIKDLYNNGVRVLLIDEATKAEDFSQGSAILSDIFSGMGMKILLTGTDSLKFSFADGKGLYGRNFEIRTTHIPIIEWLKLIKVNDFDMYIEYGGTLCHEFSQYKRVDFFHFANTKNTYEYTDAAIAQNIQHSLETEEGGKKFYELRDLYIKNILTGIINRIVERENHYILLDTIQRSFFPQDLADGISNIAKDTNRGIPEDFFDRVDIKKIVDKLKKSLLIDNDKIISDNVSSSQLESLKDYLFDLDLFVQDLTYIIRIRLNGEYVCTEDKDCNICVQPGLRFNHAKTLVLKLSEDEAFQSLPKFQQEILNEMFLNMAKGRILEEIIRFETRLCLNEVKNLSVSKIVFNRVENIPHGEYDMLIYNSDSNTCQIFEIKHSKYQTKRQSHWLRQKENNALTEYFFGKIVKRSVIYLGKTTCDEIQYINAIDFLKNINSYII